MKETPPATPCLNMTSHLTYDEEIFYGIMYINSKGKLGSKPKDYVSTKPYTIGGKTYPPIRKARVFKRKKK